MDHLGQSDEALISCFGDHTESVAAAPPGDSSVPKIPDNIRTTWKPPDQLWTKLNTDASYISSTGEAWWGAILRSSEGDVLSTAWGSIPHCSSAIEAECLACVEGLRSLCSSVDSNLVVESDSKTLTKAIATANSDRSDICFSLRSIAASLSRLNSSKVNWVPRIENEAAHCLAKFAREKLSSGFLVGSCTCLLNRQWL